MELPAQFRTTPLAHRGLHDLNAGRPENSRAAVQAALSHGYGIETDLQLSQDGQAIVFHDTSLDRLTDQTGLIREYTAIELGNISLAGTNERIPTLTDILDMVTGQVPLLIELKDQHGALGETDKRLEQAVADALQGYNGPVALMSFNPHMVYNLAQVAPNTARGLITCGFSPDDWPNVPEDRLKDLRDIPDFDPVAASFISHNVTDLEATPVARLKARGVPILCWTVRSAKAETMARAVADNITFEGYLAYKPV